MGLPSRSTKIVHVLESKNDMARLHCSSMFRFSAYPTCYDMAPHTSSETGLYLEFLWDWLHSAFSPQGGVRNLVSIIQKEELRLLLITMLLITIKAYGGPLTPISPFRAKMRGWEWQTNTGDLPRCALASRWRLLIYSKELKWHF